MSDGADSRQAAKADESVFRFYDDVERELRGAVRDALAQKCPLSAVAARFDTPDPTGDRELWSVLGTQLGLAGLLVPEALGGAGATAREAAVVLEEIGRGVAPAPFLTSAVWATTLLAGILGLEPDGGSTAEGLLQSMAAGETTAAVTARADTGSEAHQAVAEARRDGDAVLVDGEVRSVVGAREADVLLVPAALEQGPALLLVPASASGVRRAPVVSLDESQPLTDVTFDAAPASVLALGAAAVSAFEHALLVASALLASEQLGVAERCLEETVGYVKARHQFGRSIGSFQVVKHRLADLWAQVEGARTAARYAATCAAIGSADLPIAAALAQAYCSDAAVKAAEECVQLHGGIGFTWEHPAHLWLKRAMADAVLFGGAAGARGQLAVLVGLDAAGG